MPNKMALSFFRRMKDEGVMAIFLKSCSQKLEKEDDFECLDAFHEGEFRRTLRSLAPSEAEFNGE